MKHEIDALFDVVFGDKKKSAIDRYKVDTTPTLTFGDAVITPTQKETANVPIPDAQTLAQTSDALTREILAQRDAIATMQDDALADLQRISRELETPRVQNLAAQPEIAVAVEPGTGGVGLEGFDELATALSEHVFGQEEFLRKLTIAMKRPFVMGHTGNRARNSFFLSGNDCTGKTFALTQIVQALHKRKVFASDDIAWVDLSLYATPADEKLFLQDLYMALASDAQVVAFTHYEQCHRGFLSIVADLVIHGESILSNRYLLQQGRLVDAGNALAADAVRALTPRGKYLVLLSTAPLAKVADYFGAPFVNTLGDICTTAPLNTESLTQISKAQGTLFCTKCQDVLQCTVTIAQDVHTFCATTDANGGAQDVLNFWDEVYRALAQHQLECDTRITETELCIADNAPCLNIAQTVHPIAQLLPPAYQGDVQDVRAALDEIVGLAPVKEYIFQLEHNLAMQARRKAAGMKSADVSMHMIFSGNPGTGKTTIARIVSKYLKSIGVLSGGQLIEVSRANLVGKYVGHTAPLTAQVIQSALGGVLFIDEAYSLCRGKDDAFGLEAIDTIVKGMEDHRDNLVVILAGYTKEMETFLMSNSGLKSRFANNIEFPDYTGEELLAITKLIARKKEYVIADECTQSLLDYYKKTQLLSARDAGNGRFARNTLEDAILQQAKRCATQADADLSLLLPEDFILPQ